MISENSISSYKERNFLKRNIWNENNIMDKTDSIVENFKFLFSRVYNSYSLTRFLQRFHSFVSKSLKFVRRSLNFMKNSWKLMISCRTTRYIATIYKKYPSIFPFLFFFFFFLYSINSRYEYASYMLVDPKIHFYKYRSQYFSSVFDIFLETRGSWLFSFELFARGKSRFPFFRSKNVANAFSQIRYTAGYSPRKLSHGSFNRTFREETLEKIFEDAKKKKVEGTRKSFLLDRIVAAIKLHYARGSYHQFALFLWNSTTRSR